MPPALGPRDELSGPGLPPAWRALLVPSLVHGACAGATLGVALLPIALLLEATRGAPFRVVPCAATFVLGALIGVLGAAPAAALEARAHGRSAHPLVVSALCGGLVALAAVLVAAQAAYLKGVVFGGIDGGMHRLADAISAFLQHPAVAGGVTGGVLLGLATPFALVTALRLRGASARAQAFLVAAAHLGLMLALFLLLGALGVVLSDGGATKLDVDRLHPVAGGLLMAVGTGLGSLFVPGLPLAFLLPPALRLGDRLGRRVSPSTEAA